MTDEVDEMSAASRGYRSFLDLPITLSSTEWNGEWSRKVERAGTVKDLLTTWDIDDPDEQSEMAQVLRHLRTAFAMLDDIDACLAQIDPFSEKCLVAVNTPERRKAHKALFRLMQACRK